MKELTRTELSTLVGGDFMDRLRKQRNRCFSGGSCSRYHRMMARYARRHRNGTSQPDTNGF